MLRSKNNVLPIVVDTPQGRLETWIRVSNRWGSAVRLKPKVGKWLLTREFSGKSFSGKALECCKLLVIECRTSDWELFEVATSLLGLSSLSKLMEFIEDELSCPEKWNGEFLNKAYNLVDQLHDAAYDKKFGG